MEPEVKNLSRGGLCFNWKTRLSEKHKYEAEVTLVNGAIIRATVRILWMADGGDEALYGCYFSQIDSQSQEKMLEFLEESHSTEIDLVEDRRQRNRRFSNASPSPVNHRKLERRADARLRERQGIVGRLLPKEFKQLLHRRVVVTGLGIVSPIGLGKDQFLLGLRSGVSGIRPLTRFDSSQFPCRIGGEVAELPVQKFLDPKKAKRMDLATQMGVIAALMAGQDSRLKISSHNRRRLGVSMGTTMGGLGWAFSEDDVFENHGYPRMHPYTIAAASPNACSGEVAVALRANGPCVTFAQGCTSAASAITYGYDQIRLGQADLMFSGGCEAPFIPSIYGAFCRSGIMAKAEGDSQLPRPFSKNRNGIVLGEGAGVLVLEELEHAMARNATIYAEIVGASNTCDGYEMIQPQMNGLEAGRAISLALESAEVTPEEVDVIFTHAPGSRSADAIEMKALRQVFRTRLKQVAAANLKAMVGYAQGATTAIECVAASLSLHHQFVPPVIHSDNPEIALNISKEVSEKPLHLALINCFGFGGKNVCLVLRGFHD